MQGDSLPIQTADTVATTRVAVPEPSALAVRYHRSGNLLWAGATLLDLLVPAALLFTGFSARVRKPGRATRAGPPIRDHRALRHRLRRDPGAGVPAAELVRRLRAAARLRTLDRDASAWVSDWAKGRRSRRVFAALLLWIPYRLLRASPRRWWLWTGLLTAPLTVLGDDRAAGLHRAALRPIRPDARPRAGDSGSSSSPRRAGIPDSRIFEVQKSDETRLVNAYVTASAAPSGSCSGTRWWTGWGRTR